MNDSPQYEAFRAFARSEIRAARLELKAELAKEIKDEFREILTRATPQVIEAPPGKDGKDGRGISRIYIQPDGILAVRYTDSTEEYSVGKVVGEKGDPGKDGAPGIGERGVDGKDGAPSTVPGQKGDPGEKGERGANGIATREEIESIVEERFSDVQVRSLADVFEGVYDHSKLYPPGRIAVLDGQSWLSMVETRAQPGVSSDWKLLAKKGRDGRDKSK